MRRTHSDGPAHPVGAPLRVAVLGAGGRAGRAISREFVSRGHHVTGVVRDTGRHRGLTDLGIALAQGDAADGSGLVDALRDSDIVVVAVTPFSGPPPSFDGFDEAYYEHVVEAVAGAARVAPAARVAMIGLFATLAVANGATVMDDPAAFPPALLPFARAHARALPALRRRASVLDWLVLTPPAGLGTDGGTAPTDYVLTEPPVERGLAAGVLGYDLLARAVADEAEAPTWHRTQVAVLPAPA